jgi:heme oxygenase
MRNAHASAMSSIRAILREATFDVHQRLHEHCGLAAVNAGRITMTEYRSLLGRLLGFHAAFENKAGLAPERSQALCLDLAALGCSVGKQDLLPRCTCLPPLDDEARLIGARYVVEGSALGGLQLARGLDRLFGPEQRDGRRFFIGKGPATASAWRAFLIQLETVACSADAEQVIVTSAQETFAAYDIWMRDWKAALADTGVPQTEEAAPAYICS